MTNGADHHHGANEKNKPRRVKAKPKDSKAALKRKNLLPSSLAGQKTR